MLQRNNGATLQFAVVAAAVCMCVQSLSYATPIIQETVTSCTTIIVKVLGKDNK